MASEIREIVRHVEHRRKGRDWIMIYNDGLRNGVRSVKVGGWGLADYEHLQRALRRVGFDSEIVQRADLSPWAKPGRVLYRIHILPRSH